MYSNSSWCILHLDFPSEREAEFDVIQRLKRKETQRRVAEGNFNFRGAKIYDINSSKVYGIWIGKRNIINLDFYEATIKGDAQFDDAVIKEHALFSSATIEGEVLFGEAIIGGAVFFEAANLKRGAFFAGANIGDAINFEQATVKNGVTFRNSLIKDDVWFAAAKIGTCLAFENATVRGRATFTGASVAGECWFDGAKFEGEASFDFAAIPGSLSFRNATFNLDAAKESACRAAKQNCERRGAKEEANYYFYQEMKARRRQKTQPIRALEKLLIQYTMGYGAYPSRLAATWLLAALISGILLGLSSGEIANIGLGFVGAFVPGFAISRELTGVAEWVAGVETVIGTFLWAAFIAVFSRKYMK
ncbi:MAG: pentapeptide repeat-containing protein [Halobacteriota archaeon]